MKHRRNALGMLLVMTVVTAVTALSAAAAQSVGRAELKQRFEQRYAELQQLKRDSVVGETAAGFVAVTPGGASASGVAVIVEQENRDRTLLYRLLADELKTDLAEPERSLMTPAVVAGRNARRNFEKAAASEQLRVAEGIWITRRTHPWIVRLLALEEKGIVGETSEGYVARVTGSADTRDADGVIEHENESRRERYERIAAEQGASVEQVARREAELRFEAAHPGVFLRRDDGTWQPK